MTAQLETIVVRTPGQPDYGRNVNTTANSDTYEDSTGIYLSTPRTIDGKRIFEWAGQSTTAEPIECLTCTNTLTPDDIAADEVVCVQCETENQHELA